MNEDFRRPLSLWQFWQAPLVWVALAWTLGVVLDRFLVIDLQTSLALVLSAAVLWLFASRGKDRKLALLFLAVAIVDCGMIHHHLATRRVMVDDVYSFATEEPLPIRLTGWVASEPNLVKHAKEPLATAPGRDVLRFVLDAQGHGKAGSIAPVAGLVIVSMPMAGAGKRSSLPDQQLHMGDRVSVAGNLVLPESAANEDSFDYADVLHDQSISTLLNVPPDAQAITVEERASMWSFFGWLGKIRTWGKAQLEKHLSAHQGIAVALLLGDGSSMTTKDWDKYNRTGVVHALAVSGQHLVVLAGFLGFLLKLARVRLRSRALFVTMVLICYAFLSGGRPAAMRAAWMVTAFSGGILLQRVVLPANAFALSWLGVVIVQPADIFTSGCLLSFLCVLMLMWALSMVPEAVGPPDPLQHVVAQTQPFVVSVMLGLCRHVGWLYLAGLIVWSAIFPLIAYRFNLVSLVALLIGPPVVILCEFALIGGFLLLLCCAVFPPLIKVLAWCTQICLGSCEHLVDAGLKIPGGHFHVPNLPAWWVVLFYLILIPALTVPALRRRWRWTIAGVALWSLITCWLWWGPSAPAGFRCTFLSVGHGGCTVIETAGGRVLIYDAGSLTGPELTRRHIAPFLWRHGYSRIDEVVLSHADADHFNGLPALLECFSVRQITTTPSFADRKNRPVRLTLAAIAQHAVPVRQVKTGDRWELDDVRFEVLHPPPVGPEGIENVRSLVLRVRQGNRSLLLTGDLQDAGLDQVLSLPAGRIDVLMSPHHGSKTSNTRALADWAKPQVVISCQRRPVGSNWPENVFEKRGIPFLGTWPHGSVTIRERHGKWQAETYKTKEVIPILE
jgi:competence protein ComEC